MEHPLIGSIDDLDIDQLSSRINDLYGKLAIAQRSGNGHLSTQLRMALETFQNKYQQRLQETYAKRDENVNFEDKIKIK